MNDKVCFSKRFSIVFVSLLLLLFVGFLLSLSRLINGNMLSTSSRAGSPRSKLRVIGGNYALPGDYPFFVAIGINGRYYDCSGSLIDKQWVVTARHCVTDAAGKTANPAKVNITTDYVNHTKSMNEIQSGREDFAKNTPTVSDIVLYTTDSDELYIKLPLKSWEKLSFINDIALLKLNTPVDLPTISIPRSNINISDSNSQAVILGIGNVAQSSIGTPTRSQDVGLKYAKLTLKKNTAIYAHSNMIEDSTINARYLASYFLDNWTAGASGDSGGPVIMEDANKKIQIGLTKNAVTNLITVEQNYYLNISYYSSWITEKTGIQPESGTWNGALIPTAQSRSLSPTPAPSPIPSPTPGVRPFCSGNNRFCSTLSKCEDYGNGNYHENANFQCGSDYYKCCEKK